MKFNRCLAEAVGTFALVFAGCLAIITNDVSGGALSHIGISMVFGLVVMAMIYSVGNISGAHLNPAVSLGFFLAGRLTFRDTSGYIVSQLIGAMIAAALLRFLFVAHDNLGATIPSVGWQQAFIFEVIFTFLLMFVILNVSTGHMEKGIMAGVAVGGTVGLLALVGGPLTGASMNPARSVAPAFLAGKIELIWLYIAAPVLGAGLAAPSCRWIQGDDCCNDEE